MEWLMQWWPLIVGIIAAVTMPLWVPIAIIVMVVSFLLAGIFWGLEGIVQFIQTGGSFPIARAVVFLLCATPFVALIVPFFSSKRPTAGHYTDTGDSQTRGRLGARAIQTRTNPIFRTSRIDKAFLSDDRILREESGRKIGALSKQWLSSDQTIRDESGKKVGQITQSFWDSDKQVIKDSSGNKTGEIKTNFWGDRVITDSEDRTVGEIKKNIWGETVVKKRDC